MCEVRDTMIAELKDAGIPIVPLACESGYFVMAEISKMRDIIPKKYLESHEYEDDPNTSIVKNQLFMKDGSIPLDLAVCRWLAMERKVVAMPNSFFYHVKSEHLTD